MRPRLLASTVTAIAAALTTVALVAASRPDPKPDFLHALPHPDSMWDQKYWVYKSGSDLLRTRTFAFPSADREVLEKGLKRSLLPSAGWQETRISSWSHWVQSRTSNEVILTFSKDSVHGLVPIVQETHKANRLQWCMALLSKHAN